MNLYKYIVLFVLILTSRMVLAQGVEQYKALTPESIPPVNQVIKASLDALPTALGRLIDWRKRISKSAWLPEVQFDFAMAETFGRNRYDRVTRTVNSSAYDNDTSSSSSEDSGSSTSRVIDRDETSNKNEYNFVQVQQNEFSNGNFYTNVQTRVAPTQVDTSDQTTTASDSDRSSDSSRSSSRSGSTTTSDNIQLPRDDRRDWLMAYGLRLEWDLKRIFFHNDDLEAVGENIDAAEFRLGYVQDVADVYFKLAESVERLKRGKDDLHTKLNREIYAGILDSLTDNFISNYLIENPPTEYTGSENISELERTARYKPRKPRKITGNKGVDSVVQSKPEEELSAITEALEHSDPELAQSLRDASLRK